MSKVIAVIVGILICGMVVLLCFFSCIMASVADKYWAKIREDLDKNNERH